MTLTWNGRNELGDGVGVENAGGLTEFGKSVLSAMEENDIVADISHASEALFFDVADLSKRPFIATHSDAKAVCPHKRNLTDEQFGIIVRVSAHWGPDGGSERHGAVRIGRGCAGTKTGT